MIDYVKIASFRDLDAVDAKAELEKYGAEFGISLKRNKSFDNMLNDLIKHVDENPVKQIEPASEVEVSEFAQVSELQFAAPRVFVEGGLNLTWLPTSGYSFGQINSDLMKSVYTHWYKFVELWTATAVTDTYGIPTKYVDAVQSIMDEIVLRNEVRLQTSRSGTIYSVTAGRIEPVNKIVDDFVDTYGQYGGSAYQLGNDNETDFVAGIDGTNKVMSFFATDVDERGSHFKIFNSKFLGKKFVGRKNGYSFTVSKTLSPYMLFEFITVHDVTNPLFLEDFAYPAIFDILPENVVY